MHSRRLLLLLTAATLISLIGAAPVTARSPRTGDLQIAKECSAYTGQAGSFCTFTASNIKQIQPGDRIVYAAAAGAASLDTDVVIVAGPGNVARGHCTLVFASLPGRCTFSGGTGVFTHFHATVDVSLDATGLWHWDGTYRFSPRS